MNNDKKVAKGLMIITVIFLVTGFIMYVIFTILSYDDSLASDIINQSTVATTTVETVTSEADVTCSSEDSAEKIVDSNIVTSSVSMFDANKNPDFLKPKTVNLTGLNKDLDNFSENALSLTFDNIKFRAGMKVRDIITSTDWYSSLQDTTLVAGGTKFICLENARWDSYMLSDDKTKHNGDIVLWVKNFSDADATILDCVIYKFQVSYVNCFDDFSNRPVLLYRDYSINTKQVNILDTAVKTNIISADYGNCTRLEYGNINKCQVFLDIDEKKGLLGVTVFVNNFYGPSFTGKEG